MFGRRYGRLSGSVGPLHRFPAGAEKRSVPASFDAFPDWWCLDGASIAGDATNHQLKKFCNRVSQISDHGSEALKMGLPSRWKRGARGPAQRLRLLLARAGVGEAAFARITGCTSRRVNKCLRGPATVPIWAAALVCHPGWALA